MFAALLLGASMRMEAALIAPDLSRFARLDAKVASLPLDQARSFVSVAKGLAQIATTPLERARAAYVWTTTHMDYALDRRRDGTAALRDLTGDCDAHAAVYAGLCRALGVECKTIGGQVRFGLSPEPALAVDSKPIAPGQWLVSHAWNAINVDGRWGLVDTTMGGESSKTDAPKDDYFLVDPNVFATDHVPDDPAARLADAPPDLARLPLLRPAAWRMGLGVADLVADVSREEGRLCLRPKIGWRKGLRAALHSSSGSETDRVLVQPTAAGIELLLCPPGSASVVWLGFGSGESWRPVAGYPVLGPLGGRLPRVMNRFYDSGASLSGPFENDLPAGKRTEIRLRAPGAAQVVAFQGDEAAQFVREGDQWVLRAAPSPGPLEVMASYDDPLRFQGLLRYDVR